MAERWVLGVDPGRKGAICSLSSYGFLGFWDMPKDPSGWNLLMKVIQRMKPEIILFEDVHSLHGMSAKSNFAFGGWVMTLNTILEMAMYPEKVVVKIQPKIWQKEIGLIYPKKTSPRDRKVHNSAYACTLEPRLKDHIYGARGGLLDGRVDAYLIAAVAANRRYGYETT